MGYPTMLLIDMKLSYVSASVVRISPGTCLSDSSDEFIQSPINTDVDITVVGVNGRDAGVEAPNTWYYVFRIKNPTTGIVGGLLSTSRAAPVLPLGFTLKRQIGLIRNNGAGNFLDFKQFGSGNRRRYELWCDMTVRRVLAAGGNAAWTIVGCSTLVPPTADVMWLEVLQLIAGISANVRSFNNVGEIGGKGRARNSVYVSLSANDQKFQYKNSAAGGSTYIEVCDFEEEV